MSMRRCPACGLDLPEQDGPIHAYLTHSPECWAQFNLSMALHFSDLAYWPAHQLLVDAYTLQHSIGDDRRAIQSAALHLAALVFQTENPQAGDEPVIRLRKGLSKREAFPLFEPRPPASTTIASVDAEGGPASHLESVKQYARGVYEDWQPHHGAAQALIGEVMQ